jgi:hypothetical protein
MRTEESTDKKTYAKPDHHSDAVGFFPIDPRPRRQLGRVEQARTQKFNSSDVDAHGLAAALRRHVRGEVRLTMAAARSMRRTARITGKCRSAS